MNCGEIEELAPLFLSGELDGDRRRRFDAHLAGCAACYRSIETQRSIDRKLRDEYLRDGLTTGGLEFAIRSAIRQPTRRWRARWIAVAAMVLVVVTALYRVTRFAPVPRLFADAALDHRVEVVQKAPRHWRTSDSEIGALLTRFGLASERREISGSRLVRAKFCGLDGRRVLHLVYSDGRTEYSVYLVPNGSAVPVDEIRDGSENVAGFRNSRVRGLVVAGGSAEDCKRLARSAASVL